MDIMNTHLNNATSSSGLNDQHMMELATLAIKARDVYKNESMEYKGKLMAAETAVERLKLDVEVLKGKLKQTQAELEDERSNNDFLQRMIRKAVSRSENG